MGDGGLKREKGSIGVRMYKMRHEKTALIGGRKEENVGELNFHTNTVTNSV